MKIKRIHSFIVSCCCLALVFSNDIGLILKRSFSNKETFNGNVKIRIGDPNDDPDLIKKTLGQIKKRLGQFDFSIKETDKNFYEIAIKNVDDTTALKRFITTVPMIEFYELFSIVDLEYGLAALEKELTTRTPDKGENSIASLSEIINFSPPYPLNGRTMFPGQIGYIKRKDTSYLNQLLNEEKVKIKFPANLKFAYGNYSDNPFLQDSVLKIYALKPVEKNSKAFPKGSQITEASVETDKLTKTPLIIFSFNKEGADAWFLMTEKNIDKPIAIILNGNVFSAPIVLGAIEGGKSRITGNFTRKESLHIVDLLRSGDLELPVKIVESKFFPSK